MQPVHKITMQDPTGTIGAGVHSDVFQTEEGMSPGAVLILQQVKLCHMCPKVGMWMHILPS